MAQARGQGLAFEIFHDLKIDAVLLANVVQRADVEGVPRLDTARASRSKRWRCSTLLRGAREQDFDCDSAI